MKRNLAITLIAFLLMSLQGFTFSEVSQHEVTNQSTAKNTYDYTNETLEDALKERFDYNGRYYPSAYWRGNDYEDAKKLFIDKYNSRHGIYNEEEHLRDLISYMQKSLGENVQYNTLYESYNSKNPIVKIYDWKTNEVFCRVEFDHSIPNGDHLVWPEVLRQLKENASPEALERYNNFLKEDGLNLLSKPSEIIQYNNDRYRDEIVYQYITKDIVNRHPIILNGTDEQIKENQLKQILALNKWFINNTDYGYAVNYDSTKQIDDNFDSSCRHLGNFDGLPYNKKDADKISKQLGLNYHSISTNNLTTEEQIQLLENKYPEQLLIANYNKSVNVTFVGVCMDYSNVFKQVANQLGIDCQEVSSVAANHRWNVVRFADGSILHFDETQADQGLQQLYVLVDGLASDTRIGEVVRNRNSGVKKSDERLYKLMGGSREYPNEIMKSKTVPAGDVLEVFGSKNEWENFHNAFHNGTQQ